MTEHNPSRKFFGGGQNTYLPNDRYHNMALHVLYRFPRLAKKETIKLLRRRETLEGWEKSSEEYMIISAGSFLYYSIFFLLQQNGEKTSRNIPSILFTVLLSSCALISFPPRMKHSADPIICFMSLATVIYS